MNIRVANGSILIGQQILQSATFAVEDAFVSHLSIGGSSAQPDIDLEGGWLVPGFIDTQVNGGGGVLFNDSIHVAGIAAIGAAHRRFGTTGFLPTLITDTPDRIEAALDAVDMAISAGVPGVLGIHIEGPFINRAKRGIHEADRIRQLDDAMVALLSKPRKGCVMVTLAPEQVEPEQIGALVAAGVIVSGGHSDADYAQAKAAIGAGMRGVTHLYNAMSPLAHRAPGMVGAALEHDDVWAGLIVDYAHVHPAAVRIAIAAKGSERIMLVTDAMPSVGTDADHFMLQGKRIEVRDGICSYADGTLAGSDLDMATAFRNCAAITRLPPPVIAQMASASPAAFLGLADSVGSIGVGKRADWVVLDADLRLRSVWMGGVQIRA